MYKILRAQNLYHLVDKFNKMKKKDIIIYLEKTYSADEKPYFIEWKAIIKEE